MRNEGRIDEFRDRLKIIWKRVLDWRFGQLMMNALGDMAAKGRDPFFPEEQEMVEFLDEYTKRNSPYFTAEKM